MLWMLLFWDSTSKKSIRKKSYLVKKVFNIKLMPERDFLCIKYKNMKSKKLMDLLLERLLVFIDQVFQLLYRDWSVVYHM